MRVVLAYLSGIETDSTVPCSIQESVPLALNGLVAERCRLLGIAKVRQMMENTSWTLLLRGL